MTSRYGVPGCLAFATLRQALAQIPATAVRPLRHLPPESEAAPASLPVRPQERDSPAAESRHCAQCGAEFVPQREHARFCGGACRAAWNREHLGDPAVEATALTWSIAAMSEATARLPAVKVWDLPQAFAAIREAVWWTTMVDATLVRHHQGVYAAVIAAHAPAERRLIEETLAGLRFVRNWSSREAALGEVVDTGIGNRRITRWTWKPVPEPVLTWLPPRPGMGTDAVPGLPGSPGGPGHRDEFRAGRDVPHADRRGSSIRAGTSRRATRAWAPLTLYPRGAACPDGCGTCRRARAGRLTGRRFRPGAESTGISAP